MNAKQAQNNGYIFTGHYSRDKESMTMKFKEYKKAGYRGAVVIEKDSHLHRGYVSQGYSIYLEQKYFIDKEIKELQKELDTGIEAQKKRAYEKYQNELQGIDNRKEHLISKLQKLREE